MNSTKKGDAEKHELAEVEAYQPRLKLNASMKFYYGAAWTMLASPFIAWAWGTWVMHGADCQTKFEVLFVCEGMSDDLVFYATQAKKLYIWIIVVWAQAATLFALGPMLKKNEYWVSAKQRLQVTASQSKITSLWSVPNGSRGVCPSCDSEITIPQSQCPVCDADFGEWSTWRIIPFDPPSGPLSDDLKTYLKYVANNQELVEAMRKRAGGFNLPNGKVRVHKWK